MLFFNYIYLYFMPFTLVLTFFLFSLDIKFFIVNFSIILQVFLWLHLGLFKV